MMRLFSYLKHKNTKLKWWIHFQPMTNLIQVQPMTNTVSTNDKYKFNQWQIQFRPMTNTCSTNDKYSFNQSSPKLAVADAAIIISVNCSNHLPDFLIRHLKISHKIFWQEIMIKTLLTFSNYSVCEKHCDFFQSCEGNVKAGWAVILSAEAERVNGLPRAVPNCIQPSYLSKFQIYLFKLLIIFVNMGFRGLLQIAYNHHICPNCKYIYSNCKLYLSTWASEGCSKLHTTIIQIVFWCICPNHKVDLLNCKLYLSNGHFKGWCKLCWLAQNHHSEFFQF